MVSAQLAVSAALADELDRVHASDELLRTWWELELSTLSCSSEKPHVLNHEMRRFVWNLFSVMDVRAGLEVDCRYESMLIFDVNIAETVDKPISAVLAQVIGIWLMSAKLKASRALTPHILHEPLTPYLVEIVSKVGNVVGAGKISADDVDRQMVATLVRKHSGLSLRPLTSWLNVMMLRFGVATRNLLSLVWETAQKTCAAWADFATSCFPVSIKHTPYSMACGLLGISFALNGVISSDILRPSGVDEHSWQACFKQIRAVEGLCGGSPQPRVELPMEVLVGALEFAVSGPFSGIRRSVLPILEAFRSQFATHVPSFSDWS